MNSFLFAAAILICAFSFGCSRSQTSSTADESEQGRVAKRDAAFDRAFETVSTSLKTTMLDCPGRIWPRYDWKNYQVVMIHPNGSARLWRGATGQLEQFSARDLPESALRGAYSFFTLDGVKTLSIQPSELREGDPDTDEIFTVVVHEGFHDLGQREWRRGSYQRGTEYPIEGLSRLYRQMLFKNLKEYVASRGREKSAVARASYWYGKWTKEFPREVAASKDLVEGSAEYVELVASRVAKLGCRAKDEEILENLNTEIQTSFDSFFRMGLDSEGYALGSTAGVILRYIENQTAWQEGARDGLSPLEVLLKYVWPETEPPDASISKKVEEMVKASNTEAEGWLRPDLELLKADDSVRFSVGRGFGAYSPFGFFIPKDFLSLSLAPLRSPIAAQNENVSFKAEPGKSLVFDPDSPCGGAAVFLVKPDQVKLNGDRLEVDNPLIKGWLKVKEVKTVQGHLYYCGRL